MPIARQHFVENGYASDVGIQTTANNILGWHNSF